MRLFNNPFKFAPPYGWLYTQTIYFIGIVANLVRFLSLSTVNVNWEGDFAAWYMLKVCLPYRERKERGNNEKA